MTLKYQGHNASGLARGGMMGRAADLLIAGDLDPVAELGGHLSGLGFRTRHCSLGRVGEELAAQPYDAVVTLGTLSAICPPLRAPLARDLLRALAAGTLACLSTACMASAIYSPDREFDAYECDSAPDPPALPPAMPPPPAVPS